MTQLAERIAKAVLRKAYDMLTERGDDLPDMINPKSIWSVDIVREATRAVDEILDDGREDVKP